MHRIGVRDQNLTRFQFCSLPLTREPAKPQYPRLEVTNLNLPVLVFNSFYDGIPGRIAARLGERWCCEYLFGTARPSPGLVRCTVCDLWHDAEARMHFRYIAEHGCLECPFEGAVEVSGDGGGEGHLFEHDKFSQG